MWLVNRNLWLMTVNINTGFEHLQLLLDKVCLFTWPALAGEEMKRVFLVSAGFKLEDFRSWVILINLFNYWAFLMTCTWGWHTQFLNKFRLATISIFLMSYYFATIYDDLFKIYDIYLFMISSQLPLGYKNLCCLYSKPWMLCCMGEKSCRYFAWRLMIIMTMRIIIIIKKPLLINRFFTLVFQLERRFWEPLIFCSFFSPFCSLGQVTSMFIALHLSQRDAQRLPVLGVSTQC